MDWKREDAVCGRAIRWRDPELGLGGRRDRPRRRHLSGKASSRTAKGIVSKSCS